MSTYIVIPPGLWSNEFGPLDWFAVEGPEGIVAYAHSEELAVKLAEAADNPCTMCKAAGFPACNGPHMGAN